MISSATDAIINMLRARIPPLIQPEQIKLCSPASAGENCLLGVYPYGILRDIRYQMTGQLRVDSSVSQAAPFCVELRFMVTSYAGKKSGLQDDIKLLENVVQLWPDSGELSLSTPLQPSVIPAPRIELLMFNEDTASKIWQFPGTPYYLSLFYKCSPIAVPSLRQSVNVRIGKAEYSTEGGGL